MDNISLLKANEQIIAYKKKYPDQTQSFIFSFNTLLPGLPIPGQATGLRCYYGLDNDTLTLIACFTKKDANGDEQDIVTNIFSLGRPCPTMCGGDNELNS